MRYGRQAVAGATALLFAVFAVSSAQARTDSSIRSQVAQIQPTTPTPAVENYPAPNNLANPTYSTIVGTPDLLGGCDFKFPVLTLPDGAVGVAAQQISTNWSNCTTVVESGTLLSPPATAGPGGASSVAATGFAPAGVAASEPGRHLARAASTDTHHFRVTWYDPINITLNWMQSNITATVSGSCVTSASGGANDYWETVTGWKHDGPLSSYQDSNYWSCSGRAIQSYDSFDNPVFCWPDDIWTVYNGVEVERTPYAWSGWVYDTHEINGPACPSLHWGGSLS